MGVENFLKVPIPFISLFSFYMFLRWRLTPILPIFTTLNPSKTLFLDSELLSLLSYVQRGLYSLSEFVVLEVFYSLYFL